MLYLSFLSTLPRFCLSVMSVWSVLAGAAENCSRGLTSGNCKWKPLSFLSDSYQQSQVGRVDAAVTPHCCPQTNRKSAVELIVCKPVRWGLPISAESKHVCWAWSYSGSVGCLALRKLETFSSFQCCCVPPRCVLPGPGGSCQLHRTTHEAETSLPNTLRVCEWMLCPPCAGFPGYILPGRHLSVNRRKWWLTAWWHCSFSTNTVYVMCINSCLQGQLTWTHGAPTLQLPCKHLSNR